jgi:epsilon-lactone hydrolase
MQSIRSKIFLWLIKNRHLLKMKLKDEVVDSSFSVTKFREEVDKATAKIKMPKGVTAKEEKINIFRAEWIIPDDPIGGKVLLYIHSGGFISGSCKTHRMHVAKFTKESQLKSLVFDYRLAPEHPFPAGLEDCVTAYKWLLGKGYKPQDIIVGGESAR